MDNTSYFVGIIVALALLAIAFLVFSANNGEPYVPPPPKPITSTEQKSFMVECLVKTQYNTCETRWTRLEEASN